MNDACYMCCSQRLSNLNSKLCRFRPSEWLSSRRPQRLPLNQLHHNKRGALVFVHFVDRTNVRMVESRCGAGFALEAFESLTVLSKIFAQDLQSYLASEPDIFSPVHHSHSALPDLLQHLPRAEASPGPRICMAAGLRFVPTLLRGWHHETSCLFV